MSDHHHDLSLQQIENDDWGDARPGATRLVETIHGLRRKPINQFSAEDFRVLLLQQVGFVALIPVALNWLEQNPLLEGDMYPGDVLVALLNTPEFYWRNNPNQLARVRHVIALIPQTVADDRTSHHLRKHINDFESRMRSVS